MQLSVLDQSVISKGKNAGQAFGHTVQLARITEELGFKRFWVAEHHNTNGMAGTSPEILISHIASNTRKIRVGSGGVLLPQYSSYKIAENFKVLESLFPNRIDLGIGRAPGGSPSTRLALTDGIKKSLNEFPRQVKNLQLYLQNHPHPEQGVTAYPLIDTVVGLWMLGVTQRGARLAAESGTAFTYGHFISPDYGIEATKHYLTHFQPSDLVPVPQMNVCVFVVCAPTQERAEEIALTQDLWLLEVERGTDTRIPSYAEANNRVLTAEEKSIVKKNRKRMVIGTPEKVRDDLLTLSEMYQTDELMIITNIYDFQDKIESYSLLAHVFQ